MQLASADLNGPHQRKDGCQSDGTGAEGGEGVRVPVVVVAVLEVVVGLGWGLLGGLEGGWGGGR